MNYLLCCVQSSIKNWSLYQMFSGPFPGIAPAIESGTIREIFLSNFFAVAFVRFDKSR